MLRKLNGYKTISYDSPMVFRYDNLAHLTKTHYFFRTTTLYGRLRLRFPCKIRYDSPDFTLLRPLKHIVRNLIFAVTTALYNSLRNPCNFYT
jgi:hypothetical protein